ncbi:MAG: type II toxin-antitoxin system prevent-host-death family antitoxin [Treponema sp.]|nr:type II toxin-antitoxin system prevent-host-death family antitoxin [Treponema sp.]
MKISTKQLRTQPGRIISMVNSGQDVTVTYRGKPSAKIIPLVNKDAAGMKEFDGENELFGLWKNRKDTENIEQYVRNMRKGRKL